ncbi:MAG: cadherin-like beta sandwich domain-containing protein [Roseburia sp.]|nr:cadherin-like beta sandwich domain-containing protein [Anaeroplasma bactoclasticum]MCM1195437.1 cadherin-like beta sandwich domain-containing protein [Roseburia sp.]
MKKFRKLKIGLLLVLMSLTVLVTFGSLRVRAAVTTDTVTFHYDVYTKETWQKYQNALNNPVEFIVDSGLKVSDAYDVDTLIEAWQGYESNPSNPDYSLIDNLGTDFYLSTSLNQSGGDYVISGTGKNKKYSLAAGAQLYSFETNNEFYSFLKNYFPPKDISDESFYPKITQAVPGDEIVVSITATAQNNPTIRQAVVVLDLAKYAQGGVSGITRYVNEELKAASYTMSGADQTNIGRNIGWTSPGTRTSTPSPAFVGALGFTIASTVSGSMSIEFFKDGKVSDQAIANTAFTDGLSTSTAVTYKTAPNQFKEDPCVITVAGLSDNVGLTDITVENKSCITATSNVTVNGDSTVQYKGSEISDGTANVTVTVQDSGKLNSASQVRYGTSLTSLNSTATVSGNSFSVDMSSVSPGQSLYATFQVISSSGNKTKWYAVELPKAKDKNADLDNLAVSGSAGGANATLSPSFSSGTVGYTVYVPKGTSNLSFTPVATGTGKTIKVSYPATSAGTTIASGSSYSIPSTWTNGQQVKFTVTAQDGVTTKDYTCTLSEVNLKPTRVDVNGGTGSSFTSNDSDADGDDHFTINNLPFASKQYTLRVNFPDTSIISKVEAFQGSVASTQNILGGNCTFNISDGGSKGAITDTIRLVVTSKSGLTQTFYIDVNRLAANTDTSLGSVSITANKGVNDTICNSVSGPNLNITYPGGAAALPITYTKFDVAATAGNSLSTVQIKINNNVATTYTFSGVNAVNVPVSIVVTAEDGSTATYSGTVSRAGADANRDFTVTDLTYTYDNGTGATLNGTYTLAELAGSTATLSNASNPLPYLTKSVSFKVVPTSSTTKAYIDGVDKTNQLVTVPISNSATLQGTRIRVLIKSEADEITRPGNTTSGGDENWIEIKCDKPDGTRVIDNLVLNHSTSSAQISNSTNSSQSGKTYSFVLKESTVGARYKLGLTWSSSTTKAYVSKTNSSSIMVAANEYSQNSLWDIGQKVYIYLQSQDGNYDTYIVDTSFEDERSKENGIADVVFMNGSTSIPFNFVETTTTYPTSGTVRLPYSVTSLDVEVTVKNAKETLGAGSGFISGVPDSTLKVKQTVNLSAGQNVFKVQGVAENGQVGQVYTFTVVRDTAGTQKTIESLIINNVNTTDSSQIGVHFDSVFNKNDNAFSFYLPRGTAFLDVALTVSPGATFTITPSKGSNMTTSPFTCSIGDGEVVELMVNVKSEQETVDGSGSGKNYKIRIYCADTDNKLDNINFYETDDNYTDILDTSGSTFIFDPNLDSTAGVQTFTVPFPVKSAFLLPRKGGFNGTVAFDSATLANLSDGYTKQFPNPQNYTIQVKVVSELGKLASGDSKITDKTRTYSIRINRQTGSNNAYLSSLEIYIDGIKQNYSIGGVAQNFAKENVGPYMVENVKSTTGQANILAVPEDSKAKLSGDIDIQTVSLGASTNTQTYRITVTAEDEKTTRTYSIQIWTTRANPDTDKSLNSIRAYSSTSATNKLSPTFAQNTHAYTVHLSSLEDAAILDFVKNSENSTLYIESGSDNETVTAKTYQKTIPVAPDSTVVYTVYLTAQDGTSTKDENNEYTITITRDPADTNATLKEFTINGKTVTGFKPGDNGGQYEVYIGDVKDVYFDGVPTNETTTITTNPATSDSRYTLNIGSNILTVITTAQDGKTTCKYDVNVIKDAPKTLDDLFVVVTEGGVEVNKLNPLFSPEIYSGYKVNLAFDQDSAIFRYNTMYTKNTVTIVEPTGNVLSSPSNAFNVTGIPVGTSTYKVRITTESGASADYSIAITRDAGSDDNSIIVYEYYQSPSDVNLTNLAVTSTETNYKYVVSRDTILFNPEITVSENATIEMPTDLTLLPGRANIKRVTVVSQTGKKKVYTFTVYPADTDFDIDDVNALVLAGGADVLDVDGTSFIDYENNHLSITVANSVSQTYLEVLGGGANSTIYVNGAKYSNQIVTLKDGTNNFVIYIKSEYGELDPTATNAQSASVTVTIIRNAKSSDSTLKELTVIYVDGTGQPKTVSHQSLPGNSPLVIEELGDSVSSINIVAVPNDPTAKVNGAGNQTLGSANENNFYYTITVTAEDGSTTNYPVNLSRGKLDLSADKSLTYIEVSDGTGQTHLGANDFDVSKTTYGTYHIPFSAQNYTITVVKPGYSPSIVLIDNQTVTSGTKTTTILDSDRGKTKTVTVQVQAENGAPGDVYTIELEFDAPSDNAKLSDLTADGVTVPGFSPEDEGGTYTLATRPYDTTSVTIGYTSADSKATVVGDLGVQLLNEGMNTFVIVVTSESGTAYTYRITVQRDYPNPYLTNLEASGEKLLDTNYKNTTFDKDVYEYTTIVTYMTLHATINASVDNENHIVTCSNSTAITTTGLLRSFNVDLVEGLNRFTIAVTSVDGKTTEYVLTIKRRGESSTNTDVSAIDIPQIPVFKTEYNNDIREYSYKVPNGIQILDVIVTPEKLPDADGDGATYQVINARDPRFPDESDVYLRVGMNTVVVLVYAEDQVSTRAIVVNVEREAMSYTIDENAYNYTMTTLNEEKKIYEIDLVDKRASAIEDFAKYIVFDSEQYDSSNSYNKKPEITVLSDISDENCREVVVRIFDGSDEEYVTFKLKSTALNSGFSIPELLQQIMPWILIAIAIIILIIILICVNRDKYGAINKKRKKELD